MTGKVLTDPQIGKIHESSLRILGTIGVSMSHPETLLRFANAGAEVDFHKELVRLPEPLISRALASAGKKFTLYGRDLQKTAAFGVGQRNYNSNAGQALWLDEIGGPRRRCVLADVVTASRFAEALDGLTIAGAMADPSDLPVPLRCVEVLATQIRNTTKPVTFWFHNRASARFIVEMLIALRGSAERAEKYPLCFPLLEPISPLRFPLDGIDLLYETARLNLPVPIGPMAQMGLSAPCSVAGTLAVENAEILAGICVTQLIRPGMPVCYGGICHAFDMSTTQLIFAGPEQAIFGVAMTQMGKHYGLPVYINAGLTDAKRPDAQAGMESGITLATGAAAGADIFGHMGICGVDQASSLDMLVLQNEVIGYTERAIREVDTSDEALGFDVLAAAGPGGSMLDTDHTSGRFRAELWFSRLLDRQFYQAWHDGGATSMEDRCRERKRQLCAIKPPPLAADAARDIDAVAAAARKELGG
jgi:trimethylamine--corrinoid protein Co-methyltransferase